MPSSFVRTSGLFSMSCAAAAWWPRRSINACLKAPWRGMWCEPGLYCRRHIEGCVSQALKAGTLEAMRNGQADTAALRRGRDKRS